MRADSKPRPGLLRQVLPVLVLLPPAFVGQPGALVVALCATATVLAATWRWAAHRIGLGTAAVSAVSLALDVGYSGAPAMALLWTPCELAGLLVLLGRAVRSVPAPRVVPVTALACAAAMALPLRFSLHLSPPRWDTAAFGLLAVPFPLAVAVGIGVYLRGLDSAGVRAVAEARVRQRLELAGLLHDSVAHEVTGIVVEVQAARFVPYDEAEAREAFARVEEAGLRALDSMDHAVATLRDSGPTVPGPKDLRALVERFSPAARFDEVGGTAGELRGARGEAAYAVVLEALTNVRRHVPGVPDVVVAVTPVDGPAVEVSVTDGGSGAAPGATRATGGSGLAAVRERVEAAGGVLEAGPRGAGWRVAAVFPVG
ncbi:histidine kinase [Umezawaea sp. Da 62-37]|uniref:sensor histidine kinase n=1 Tax=Umezawaea sp. Da 62-37 TaxID=3075927 RepID=UPI0028F72B51|nr:histidine kinase [Umezawaea sp. Da 62-37]WNV85790.1 histidine kinase [Umezawaea sp. Da 62-37]